MTFREWLDFTFYPGFDADGLSDEEYYELEDLYYKEVVNQHEDWREVL